MAWWGRWVLQMVCTRSFLLGSLGLVRLVRIGLVVFIVALGFVLVELVQVQLAQEILEDRQALGADVWGRRHSPGWPFALVPFSASGRFHIGFRRNAGILDHAFMHQDRYMGAHRQRDRI